MSTTRRCSTPGCLKCIHHGGLHTGEERVCVGRKRRHVEARTDDGGGRDDPDAGTTPPDARYAATSATLPELRRSSEADDAVRGDRLVAFVSFVPCFRPLYVYAPGSDGRKILEHHADGSSHVLTADEEWSAHTAQLGRDGLLQHGIEMTHSDEGVVRFVGCILDDECQMLRVRNAQYRRFVASYVPGRP